MIRTHVAVAHDPCGDVSSYCSKKFKLFASPSPEAKTDLHRLSTRNRRCDPPARLGAVTLLSHKVTGF
jgi:hypothetical protein